MSDDFDWQKYQDALSKELKERNHHNPNRQGIRDKRQKSKVRRKMKYEMWLGKKRESE